MLQMFIVPVLSTRGCDVTLPVPHWSQSSAVNYGMPDGDDNDMLVSVYVYM